MVYTYSFYQGFQLPKYSPIRQLCCLYFQRVSASCTFHDSCKTTAVCQYSYTFFLKNTTKKQASVKKLNWRKHYIQSIYVTLGKASFSCTGTTLRHNSVLRWCSAGLLLSSSSQLYSTAVGNLFTTVSNIWRFTESPIYSVQIPEDKKQQKSNRY